MQLKYSLDIHTQTNRQTYRRTHSKKATLCCPYQFRAYKIFKMYHQINLKHILPTRKGAGIIFSVVAKYICRDCSGWIHCMTFKKSSACNNTKQFSRELESDSWRWLEQSLNTVAFNWDCLNNMCNAASPGDCEQLKNYHWILVLRIFGRLVVRLRTREVFGIYQERCCSERCVSVMPHLV